MDTATKETSLCVCVGVQEASDKVWGKAWYAVLSGSWEGLDFTVSEKKGIEKPR